MSLFKIFINKGQFSYSFLIRAHSTAEACKIASQLFKTADKRLVIQL